MEEIQTLQNEKLTEALTTASLSYRPQRQRPSLTTLPPEILLEIASYLTPVDRVCLSLTCKTLLSKTLSTLRITSHHWLRAHYRRYGWPKIHVPALYPRLADGWLPKDCYRYCYRCHKIMPRCPKYFKKRLCKKRMPKFDRHVLGHTGIMEKEWKSMGKRKRYACFVEMWCRLGERDTCIIECVDCTLRDKERGDCAVPCPLCLERDLTSPRKPWFRKTLRSGCRHFWFPLELLAYWSLFCCVWSVKFVYDQAEWCWKACAGICCSGRRHS